MSTPPGPSETRLVLVGKAGSGKSSTGNTIVGQNVFPVGKRFARAAPTSQKSFSNQRISVQVVDTPGFFDTDLSESEVAVQLVKAVQASHPSPCAVLFVIKIGGFTNQDARAYRRLRALFDSEVSRHTIVVFTHGDHLARGHTSLEKLLDDSPEQLQEILHECERRYVVFNNKANSDSDKITQVEELVRTVHKLNEKHGGKPFTTPYPDGLGEAMIRELSERRLNTFRESELREESLQLKCDQQMSREIRAKDHEHLGAKGEQSRLRSLLDLCFTLVAALYSFTQTYTSQRTL